MSMTSMVHGDSSTSVPLRATLIDDSDLAQCGLATLLEPYGQRVEVVTNPEALAAPETLDVILFEPLCRSTMAQGLLRDLQQRSEAAVALFTWADEDRLPSPAPRLSKQLTASQTVVALEGLVREQEGREEGEPTAVVTFPMIPAPDPDDTTTTAATLAAHPALLSAADSDDADVSSSPAADASPATEGLTPRERDMLVRIAGGLTNADIGSELGLSINSVKTYIRTAYRKIGAQRRSQAMLWALENGLGTDDTAALVS